MGSRHNINDDPFGLDTSSATENMDSFIDSVQIPSESVYYAAEYLRLQSEIDDWKEKATKYKLENEDLKREVEKQTELVTKLTKEKTDQCAGFELGIDQLKRDNAQVTISLKQFGKANKIYLEKYKTLKSEYDKTKQLCSLLKSSRENNKNLKHRNTIYWGTLQYMVNFLDKCNNQLEICAKILSVGRVDPQTNIPQITSKNLNEVNSRLKNNIRFISVKVGLNTIPNVNNLLDASNSIHHSTYQSFTNEQSTVGMAPNFVQHSNETNHELQATVSAAAISATNPSSSNSHLTPVETESSSGYHPSTSPITPDDVDLNFLQGSWTGEQIFQNMV